MTSVPNAAACRGGLAALVLLAAAAWADPAQAACSANSWKINPNNQNVLESNAGAGYTPIQVTLGLNKGLSDGVVIGWSQVGGPAVTLNTTNPAAPTFLTPSVPNSGATLTFRITTTCPGGGTATDDGTVTVANVNRPPLAVAVASPPIAFEGDAVTLGGTGSSDPDGDTLRYVWTKTAGPAVTLSGANTATASFTAPTSATPDGYTLQFQLQVFDRATGGLTNTTAVVVNVTRNLPPLAVLSCPAQVPEGGPVLLDGSASNDPNGQALTYAWTQLQGTPGIAVGSETGSTVAFAAPALTLGQDGFVEFQLQVTDPRGLWDLATCMLEIRDVTPPVILVTPPAPTEALSPAGASVAFSSGMTASDNVDGDLTPFVVCVPPSGALFALGTTAVDCEVDDSIGNTGTARFDVLVQDTTAPVIDAHNDVAVEATGPGGAVVSYDSPATTDAVDVDLVATCAPASGSSFALGSHTVACDATDASGNVAAPTSFAVTVHDTTGPAIDPHDDLAPYEATGALGATVTYVSPATHDAVDGDGTATCAPASGSTFAIGATTVSCTATDTAGNAADTPTTFTVTVVDSVPPTIDPHGDIGPVEALGPGGAPVGYDAPATHDTVDGDGVAGCAPASGSLFALGSTTVTCAASDAAGNAATAVTFSVTVVDSTPPAIDPPADVGPVEATGPGGATVHYPAVATQDVVDGNGFATCAPVSGGTFALGATTVTCSATDRAGNTATPETFTVTVVDTTPPTIAPHADVGPVEATGPDGAPASYTAPATLDIVDGAGTATCAPASGSTFALGVNTVTCTARDAAGNDAVATTFSVTVHDTTPPTIDAHADVGPVEATSAAGATVFYDAPASRDAVDGVGTALCLLASGSTFPLGDTPVVCSAIDAAGNGPTLGGFTVRVRDTTAPVIAPHANLVVEATGAAGAVVTYIAPATSDAVDGPGSATCLPASGATLALGTHTVTCNATDRAGNAASATTFSVTVRDTTAPLIAPHGDVGPVEATGPAGAAVGYTRPATSDAVDGAGLATCAPPPGTTFPLGQSYVECTARDNAGNDAAATGFRVEVVDTTAPVIAPHANVTAEATSAAGAVVGYTSPATSDAVDGTGTATCLPASGTPFALGATTVTCGATDAHGNVATSTSFTVNVVDTTAPAIAAHGEVTVTATGNSNAEVAYAPPTANDLVDGSVTVSCTPPPGSVFGVGRTVVTCSATDAAGNRATSTFGVNVAYAFGGFQQPIDPGLVNTVKAGSAIPVKFGLGGYQGMQIFATGSPASAPTACDAAAPTDEVEQTVTAGSSTLQYDAGTDRYHYVWKTEKGWLGCRQLRVTLRDGSVRTAMFKFR